MYSVGLKCSNVGGGCLGITGMNASSLTEEDIDDLLFQEHNGDSDNDTDKEMSLHEDE